MIPEHEAQAMRERLEAATEGPWEWSGNDIDGPNYTEVLAVRDLPEHAYPEMQSGTLIISDADREFIAHARTDLARLLEERETLREAALYVRDAALVTVDDAMLTDALAKLDALLSVSPEEARDDAERRCRECNAPLARNEMSICEDCVRDPRD